MFLSCFGSAPHNGRSPARARPGDGGFMSNGNACPRPSATAWLAAYVQNLSWFGLRESFVNGRNERDENGDVVCWARTAQR